MKTLFTEKQHSRAHHQASTSFKHHQHGFSLIELLLVMAIIAGLMVAAFIIYPKVQAGRAANAEANILQAFQANIKSLYTNGSYGAKTTDLTAVSANAGMWPDDMISGTTVNNEWGGPVTVTATGADSKTGGANPAHYFTVKYEKVPSDVCQKLVPALIATWQYVAVGTTKIQSLNDSSPKKYDPGAVPVACGGTAGGKSVPIVMTSR